MLVLSRMDMERRRAFLDEVRIVALTDPIPNDVCAVRKGFSSSLWDRFYASFLRFLETPAGREAYFDLVAGVEAAVTSDSAFDGFREALETSGMSADSLLEAAENKLKKKKEKAAPAAEAAAEDAAGEDTAKEKEDG